MRIYKILYFAITRWLIQSFEDWLRNEDCEKLMEDFSISKELNDFLEELTIDKNGNFFKNSILTGKVKLLFQVSKVIL